MLSPDQCAGRVFNNNQGIRSDSMRNATRNAAMTDTLTCKVQDDRTGSSSGLRAWSQVCWAVSCCSLRHTPSRVSSQSGRPAPGVSFSHTQPVSAAAVLSHRLCHKLCRLSSQPESSAAQEGLVTHGLSVLLQRCATHPAHPRSILLGLPFSCTLAVRAAAV